MSYLRLQDVTMYFEVKGEGRPIVFIHGMGLSHTNWKQQVDFITANGYQTITVDIRGHGKSTETFKRFTLQNILVQISNDLYQLFQTLHINRALLVGYSTGTVICQHFATAYPYMIDGLVLSGAFPKISNLYLYTKFLISMGLSMINAKKILARGVARSNGKDDEQVHEFELEAKKVKRNDAIRLLRASLFFDGRKQLENLDLPLLVTYGGNEKYMLRYRQDYLTLSPKAEVCLFPHVNHATMTKSSKEYNKVLLDFIERTYKKIIF